MKWIRAILVVILVACIAAGIYVFVNKEEIVSKEAFPPWTPMNIIIEGGEVRVIEESDLSAEEEIPSEYEGDEEMYYIDELNPVFVLPEDFS